MKDMEDFLKEIGRYDLLSSDEEKELGKALLKGGEAKSAAREKLINSNLKLVVFWARKYVKSNIEMMDLISMGVEGLIHAADKWDYRCETKFSTYASFWIRQAISRGCLYEGNSVKIPVYMHTKLQKIKAAQKAIYEDTGRDATLQELCKYTGLKEDVVKSGTDIFRNRTVLSLDEKIGEEGDTTLGDMQQQDGVHKSIEEPYERMETEAMRQCVKSVLDSLSEREKVVLKLHFGLMDGKAYTLEEIGRMPQLNISRERVRQIKEGALTKIRTTPKLRNKLMDFAC